MRRHWIKVLLVVLVLAGAAALWKREQIGRLQAVLSLFDADRIVANFSAMDRAFLSRAVPRGDGPVTPLPAGAAMTLPAGTDDWIRQRNVTALIVMKDGQVRHESYHLGTGPDDRRISWSVAKSFLSALFGIVQAEAGIALDDPVTDHAPALRGSAYDGVTVRQILQMTSGVVFNEDYLDFWSDINRMGRVLALGQSMDGFAEGLTDRAAEPGARWHYVSIDTHVLGMVIRGATGRDVVDLMSERLIAPLGLEATPYYVTDGLGEAFVLGGLNLTSRDYARFGQMMLEGGRGIVPADWATASTAASAPTAPGGMGYGFQWWIPPGATPGEFQAQGIYGQYIHVDRAQGTVVVVNAADRGFEEPGVEAGNIAMLRALAAAASAP
jgi:CubicO group peptidase (beta-lactamase class C family)